MILRTACFHPDPLQELLSTLSSPSCEATPALLTSLVVKYFHAFALPDHTGTPTLEDITDLYRAFAAHREPDQPDSPLLDQLRTHSFALRMLADVPKTAHLIHAILTTPTDADPAEPFTVIDIGTGSGILLLAAALRGLRAEHTQLQLTGIEVEPSVAEQTHTTLHALLNTLPPRIHTRLDIRAIDATTTAAYNGLDATPIHLVCNETIPAIHQRIEAEPFCATYAALFSSCRSALTRTAFFPHMLVCHAKREDLSIPLTAATRFQIPAPYKHLRLAPQAIPVDNDFVLLDRLGEPYAHCLGRQANTLITRRW